MEFITLVLGFLIGYGYAHIVVAEEIEKLGGFYVGKAVYKGYKVKEGIGNE